MLAKEKKVPLDWGKELRLRATAVVSRGKACRTECLEEDGCCSVYLAIGILLHVSFCPIKDGGGNSLFFLVPPPPLVFFSTMFN